MTEVRDRILQLLRAAGDRHLSGEEIRQATGVSRAAVWKQIEQLRKNGYTVTAVPSRGYRLEGAPDALTPAEVEPLLATATFGRPYLFFETTDSTNLRARELGEQGAPEGTVVVADLQTAGRGRLGRSWVSPAGVNLYLSLLLRPILPPREAPLLTFLAAAAAAAAVEEAGGCRPSVKWPNDVLLNGRKVGGVLSEMQAEAETVHYVVLGLGLNLNMTGDQLPSLLRYPASSLALETGRRVDRAAFTADLLGRMEALYGQFLRDGFKPVRRAWESYFDLVGRQVAVEGPGSELTGRVEGIDGEGALLLRLGNGDRQRVLAGDVRPC